MSERSHKQKAPRDGGPGPSGAPSEPAATVAVLEAPEDQGHSHEGGSQEALDPAKAAANPEGQDLTLALAKAQDEARRQDPWVVDALSYDPAAAAAMNSRIDDVADGYAAPVRRVDPARQTIIQDSRPEGGGEPYPMFSAPNRETLKG